MNLCSDGHQEVCYEGRVCPACALRELIIDAKDAEISELRVEVDKLETKCEELAEAVRALAAANHN